MQGERENSGTLLSMFTLSYIYAFYERVKRECTPVCNSTCYAWEEGKQLKIKKNPPLENGSNSIRPQKFVSDSSRVNVISLVGNHHHVLQVGETDMKI